MYCKKCGKTIDYEAEYCYSCQACEKDVYVIEEETGVKYGLKNSLVALIFSILSGLILIFVTMFLGIALAGFVNNARTYSLSYTSSVYGEYGEAWQSTLVPPSNLLIVSDVFCLLFSMLAFAFSLVALILGIRTTVACAKRLKGSEKPIAPFILTCSATVFGCIDILWACIAFVSSIIAIVGLFIPM